MEQATPVVRTTPRDTIAGFLSAVAIFAGLIGIAWHPLRLVSASIILAMIAAGMAPKSTLVRAAVFIAVVSFFCGMLVCVLTGRALW